MRQMWVLCMVLTLVPVRAGAESPATLATPKDKVSYALGVQAAKSMKQQGIDVDPDLMMRGLKDALSGKKLLLPESDLGKALRMYQAELRQKRTAEQRLAAAENQKKGDAFLAANAKKDGVVTLPGGLQYKILKAGQGNVPTVADRVQVQYRGTHIDGTEFDSSYDKATPTTIPVKGATIAGWTEALTRMPVGSKWQLVIPPNLAYGTRGAGSIVGPNETLIFELELLAIK